MRAGARAPAARVPLARCSWRKSGSQGSMDRCAHRPCWRFFVNLRVRLTKPPQIAGRTGRSLAANADFDGLAPPSDLRRLVQVSCGWPRVGRALDLRAPAGTRTRRGPSASSALFRDFCTPAASRGGPGASFCEFCTAAAREPSPARPPPSDPAQGAGGDLGTKMRPDLRKRAIPFPRIRRGAPPRVAVARVRLRRAAARVVQKSGKDAPRPPPNCHRGAKVRKKCTAPPRARGAEAGGRPGRRARRATRGQKFRFAKGGKRRRPARWSKKPFCEGRGTDIGGFPSVAAGKTPARGFTPRGRNRPFPFFFLRKTKFLTTGGAFSVFHPSQNGIFDQPAPGRADLDPRPRPVRPAAGRARAVRTPAPAAPSAPSALSRRLRRGKPRIVARISTCGHTS